MLAVHQREAADRALALLRARRGVLLADEVGLGKSFVAAEVMRHYGDVELVVPAALVRQWRTTLRDFGVAATVVTHDALASAAVVPERRERLVVVDEAHAFRNPRTRRYAALAHRTTGARVLLVTATPVCNGVADLEALLRLIVRDDVLSVEGVPSIDAAFAARDRDLIAMIVRELVIRRDRSVLPAELQFGALDRRVVRHPVLNAAGIDSLQFPLVGDGALLRRFLWRRLESSEAALIESLRRQLRFYERALEAIAAGRTLPKRDYRQAFAHEEDREAFQQVLFWDLFAPAGDADPQAIHEEMARIESLIAFARAAPPVKRDLLVARLGSQPTLVFTGSAATARDLHEALPGSALVTSRERSRDAVLDAFCRGRIQIVISTDLSSEGLNLQRAAVVVHYDIPWNPVRLDQRNGRTHRIGQTRESVEAVYFLPETRETRIVETVARKNRVRRRVFAHSTTHAPAAERTLRPRVARDAAITRFRSEVPDQLLRRHKAGLEQLIDRIAGESPDPRRLADLVALVDLECSP